MYFKSRSTPSFLSLSYIFSLLKAEFVKIPTVFPISIKCFIVFIASGITIPSPFQKTPSTSKMKPLYLGIKSLIDFKVCGIF